MITLNHKQLKKSFKMLSTWKDITLDKAVKMKQLELPHTQDAFEWFEYMDNVVEAWQLFTELSKEEVEQITPNELVWYFTNLMLPKLQDLNSEMPLSYEPKMIESFEHQGITYYMPTSLYLGEDVVLMQGQTARKFTEASNILAQYSQLKRDGLKVMHTFTACVVKETINEVWNEQQVIERGERFKTLTMDKVWEVFFCTQAHLYRSAMHTLSSLKEKPISTKPKAKGLNSIISSLKLLRAEYQAQLKMLTS